MTDEQEKIESKIDNINLLILDCYESLLFQVKKAIEPIFLPSGEPDHKNFIPAVEALDSIQRGVKKVQDSLTEQYEYDKFIDKVNVGSGFPFEED